MVYEICDKNSGRIGGKFMERKKHKNPATGRYYEEKDFLIGHTILLNGYRFQIQGGDEYTEKYMEDNAETFPMASLTYVINKIKEGAHGHHSLQDYAVHLMRTLDANGDGFLSFEEFKSGLDRAGLLVTDHEMHTIVRHFDKNGDGKISMEEFYNTLAAE